MVFAEKNIVRIDALSSAPPLKKRPPFVSCLRLLLKYKNLFKNLSPLKCKSCVGKRRAHPKPLLAEKHTRAPKGLMNAVKAMRFSAEHLSNIQYNLRPQLQAPSNGHLAEKHTAFVPRLRGGTFGKGRQSRIRKRVSIKTFNRVTRRSVVVVKFIKFLSRYWLRKLGLRAKEESNSKGRLAYFTATKKDKEEKELALQEAGVSWPLLVPPRQAPLLRQQCASLQRLTNKLEGLSSLRELPLNLASVDVLANKPSPPSGGEVLAEKKKLQAFPQPPGLQARPFPYEPVSKVGKVPRGQRSYIINIEYSFLTIKRGIQVLWEMHRTGGSILFLNTNPILSFAVRKTALKLKQGYVNDKWVGGLLTNWLHIKKSRDTFIVVECIRRRTQLLGKNITNNPKYRRLKKIYRGLVNVKRKPTLLVALNAYENCSALHEAKVSGIPTIGFFGGSCRRGLGKMESGLGSEGVANSSMITYPILCNEYSLHLVHYFLKLLVDTSN